MTSTTVPDVLRNAADIIDKRGWHQSRDIDPGLGGGVCANGAMRLALGSVVVDRFPSSLAFNRDRFSIHAPTDWSCEQVIGSGRLLTAAHNVLGEFMGRHGLDVGLAVLEPGEPVGRPLPSIIQYNDRRATCAEDVTKVLRDAATWLESAPLAVLDEIERTPRPAPHTPTPYESVPVVVFDGDLVNA